MSSFKEKTVFLLLLVSLLFSTGHSALPIFNARTAVVQGSLVVTCAANRVVLPDSAKTITINELRIYRIINRPREDLIATYLSRATDALVLKMKITPSGRHWTINFFDGSNWNNHVNQYNMKIILRINDIECADAGQYKCEVTFSSRSGRSDKRKATQDLLVNPC